MTYLPADTRYDSMPYRRTGRSGLKLPAISLGLWQNFGGTVPVETQRAILRRAFDLGITHFDLANNYGPPYGSAETNFGRIFGEDFSAHRDEVVISTKAGYDMSDGPYGEWGSRKTMLSSLDQSLSRLNVDYVDVFYSHRPDPNTPIEETMGALAHAVRQGKVLYVGVSNYDPTETRAAAVALSSEGVPLTIHQPCYNMFERLPEQGLFEAIAEIGAGSIVYSPLAQGLLTSRYLDGVPAGSRASVGRWITEANISEVYLERARALNAIAQRRGQSLAQLAIAWVLRQPAVTSALVGASSTAQLEDNLKALDQLDLTDDELDHIEPFAVDGTGEDEV